MSEATPEFASITHDVYVVRQGVGKGIALHCIAVILRNNLGQHFDIVFDNGFAAGDVMIACPIGCSLDDVIDKLRSATT